MPDDEVTMPDDGMITLDPCQWCGAVEGEPCRDSCKTEEWMDYPLDTRLEISDAYNDEW